MLTPLLARSQPYSWLPLPQTGSGEVDSYYRLSQVAWIVNSNLMGTTANGTGLGSYPETCDTITANDYQAAFWTLLSGTSFSNNIAYCDGQTDGICASQLIGTANSCNVVYLMLQAFTAIPEHSRYNLPTCGNFSVPVVLAPDGKDVTTQVLLLTFPRSWCGFG